MNCNVSACSGRILFLCSSYTFPSENSLSDGTDVAVALRLHLASHDNRNLPCADSTK